MARVSVEIEYTTLESEEGNLVDGVVCHCVKCGHETESFGQEEKSVKRCLALLRDECPLGQSNFYVTDDE